MQLHQLEYVLAVAKYRSFTRAAEEINISQSSLSQQILNLEKELGVSLFIRTTRSVRLTPVGEDFVSHAMRVMSELNAVERCIEEYVSINKGHLTLGIIPIVGHYSIPNLIAGFKKEFPGVNVNLLEGQDDVLLDMLSCSRIDAAIFQRADPDPSIQYFPLFTDRMVAIMSSRHPLSFRKSIDLSELKNEKFILTPETSAHHHDLENACQQIGFEPEVLMTCSSVKTMIGLASENLGITFLSSEVAATMMTDSNLAILDLTPTISRRICLAIQKSADISPALRIFMKYTTQWINIRNCSNYQQK